MYNPLDMLLMPDEEVAQHICNQAALLSDCVKYPALYRKFIAYCNVHLITRSSACYRTLCQLERVYPFTLDYQGNNMYSVTIAWRTHDKAKLAGNKPQCPGILTGADAEGSEVKPA